jgi:hypothetical protein
MKNIFIIVALAAFLIVFYPLTVIWALNVIFPILQIPYSLETWAAIIILSLFVRNITLKE